MPLGVPAERVMLVRAELPGEGVSVGSGTLLGERLVLTAAHVVFGNDGMPLRAIGAGPAGMTALPAGSFGRTITCLAAAGTPRCWKSTTVPGGRRGGSGRSAGGA